MKGLLFTPEMAYAVLTGRKTETRRVVPGRMKRYEEGWSLNGDAPRTLPGDWCHVHEGDEVCVLTTWAVAAKYDDVRPSDLPKAAFATFWHAGTTCVKPLCRVPALGKSRPGRFLPNTMRHLMPKLRIEEVVVRHVREIDEASAVAEGVTTEEYLVEASHGSAVVRPPIRSQIPLRGTITGALGMVTKVTPLGARRAFQALWDTINRKRGHGWARNPQVFVIRFRLLP